MSVIPRSLRIHARFLSVLWTISELASTVLSQKFANPNGTGICMRKNEVLRHHIALMDFQINRLQAELDTLQAFQKLIEETRAESIRSPNCPTSAARRNRILQPAICLKLVQVILGVILMVLQRKYRIVPSLTDQDAILLVQITFSSFLIITPPLLLNYVTASNSGRTPLQGSLAEVIYLLVGAVLFLTCGATYIHNWLNFRPADFDGGLLDKLPAEVLPAELPLPFDIREVKTDLKRYREAALALGGMSVANGILYFLDSWLSVYTMHKSMS